MIAANLQLLLARTAGAQNGNAPGGEPTLLGDAFLNLIGSCHERLPNTALHVLSNGRHFNYLSFAQALAGIGHQDLVVGIPLYSDLAWHHDFIVQSPNAFDQTIRGLLNLARCKVSVELRIVIHAQSIGRLTPLAEFIGRNLPFVNHVALMGLEPIGFAKSNIRALWMDPADYQKELIDTVERLVSHSMNVSIYNHQLCVLPQQLWQYSRMSISDWKNIYLPECQLCCVREDCGGLFHSSARIHSRSIKPFLPDNQTSSV